MAIMNESWEDLILRAYRTAVDDEEFENKATRNPDAVRKIAYYFKETGYSPDDFVPVAGVDEGHDDAISQVQFLFDFLNFTDGI